MSKVIFLFILVFCSKTFANTTFENKNTPNEEVFVKLNSKIDTSLVFKNQDGKEESLKKILQDQKVLILTLNYYSCTTMCTFQFLNLSNTLKKIGWKIGDGFKVATISFDPKDTTKKAKELKNLWVPKTGQKDGDWNFYTGELKNISILTKQLNFYYEPDGEEYSHAGVLYFINQDGIFYRYLNGIVYNSNEVKNALIDTSDGKLGTLLDKFYLKIKKFEPNYGKYASKLSLPFASFNN